MRSGSADPSPIASSRYSRRPGGLRDAGYIEVSPIDGFSAELVDGREQARDRVPTDAEIQRLWHGQSQHLPLLRFLLLTAGRRIGEAQRATWTHTEGHRWIIPAEHAKNGRQHWGAEWFATRLTVASSALPIRAVSFAVPK